MGLRVHIEWDTGNLKAELLKLVPREGRSHKPSNTEQAIQSNTAEAGRGKLCSKLRLKKFEACCPFIAHASSCLKIKSANMWNIFLDVDALDLFTIIYVGVRIWKVFVIWKHYNCTDSLYWFINISKIQIYTICDITTMWCYQLFLASISDFPTHLQPVGVCLLFLKLQLWSNQPLLFLWWVF